MTWSRVNARTMRGLTIQSATLRPGTMMPSTVNVPVIPIDSTRRRPAWPSTSCATSRATSASICAGGSAARPSEK